MAGYSNQKVFILYEDEHLLVVKKPFGMESQRGKSFAMDQESLLRGYLSSKTKTDNPYLAVVHRLDRPVSGEILLPYASNPSPEGGWHFLSIVLETGRHHQIRAQLSHAGMPIAADVRYGGAKVHGPRGAIALCAAQLSFRHPITGKYLTFSWNDDTNITAVNGR